jgi:quinol-cytochrome oxidoreductase complex cytochrome b subunit
MATTEKTKKKATASTTAKKVPKEQSTFARVTTLVVGDAIVFLIFAAIGRNNHGEASGFAAIPQIVLTALPFAVGWFIVAPFVGAYRRVLADQPKAMAIRTAFAWFLAWPVGLLLRWFFVDRVKVPPTSASDFAAFATVTFIFNLIVLMVWRVPYALNNNARRNIMRVQEK